MRCLIIDDDESPRSFMGYVIAKTGHRVDAVGSAEEALAALETHSFDVAIVDLGMPGMAGDRVIARMRAHYPHIRILVVSGYSDVRHVVAALEAGADGYLLKDDLGESLPDSLQELRAGHTPLSPRVAAIVLRQWRKVNGVARTQLEGILGRVRPL